MKYLHLIWASLFRKKTRTLLTMLSLLSAFLLFGLLNAVNVVFNTTSADLGAEVRLVTQARTSFTQALPLRLLPQIEAVPGVADVYYAQWFGGEYQDPKNQMFAFAVDPERFLRISTEWVLPPEQRDAFIKTRTGFIAGRKLADFFGWEVGKRYPINSNIWPQQNGSKTWEADLVGIFDGKNSAFQDGTAGLMYFNYAFFDEARQFGKGGAGIYTIKLQDPNKSSEIAPVIDALFENSPDETKTQTESDFQLGFSRQIGDIGLIVRGILAAVFFTILLLTGNTMAQAVRERIPELAVMKTLGFTDGVLWFLVLCESLLLVFIGGIAGMLLAAVLGPLVAMLSPRAPALSVNWSIWMQALVTMAVVAVVVGIGPALRARRVAIVDALAGR